jgi:hypothetical protein
MRPFDGALTRPIQSCCSDLGALTLPPTPSLSQSGGEGRGEEEFLRNNWQTELKRPSPRASLRGEGVKFGGGGKMRPIELRTQCVLRSSLARLSVGRDPKRAGHRLELQQSSSDGEYSRHDGHSQSRTRQNGCGKLNYGSVHEPPGRNTGVSPVCRSQDSHGRDARATISSHWFMVPMHGRKAEGAFYEPGSAGIPAGELSAGVSPARRRRSRNRHWFMDRVHCIIAVGLLMNRAVARTVAADVRRRPIARITLPPRYLGGYGV